jgi:hypothetical protein
MKRIKLLAVMAMLPFLAVKIAVGAIALPTGPLNFKLTAIQQQTPTSVTFKTNTTSLSTNITTTVKSSLASKTVTDKDILNLLANSFTNLPTTITNGQLVSDGEGDVSVVTATSTNNVTAVLRISATSDPFISGTESTDRVVPPGTVKSETESVTWTQSATLTYNDNGLTTRDGTQTSITLTGLLVTKYNDATSKFTTSFILTGSGVGNVRNKYTLIIGTVSGTVTGNVDLDDAT